jgi:hypothetical protein
MARRESEGQRTWVAFASDSLSQATGTLVAAAVIYLVGVSGGVIEAVPIAIAVAVAAAGGALGVAVATALRPWIFRRSAAKLLRNEPEKIVEPLLRSPFASEDTPFEDALAAIENLPEPERTIFVLRLGVPMTLEQIGEGLRLTRERVRQYEGQALAKVRERLRDEPENS